jgi:ceramide glucosyltransferase
MIRHILEIIALLGTVAGMGYCMLCLWSAVDFIRERNAGESARATPPRAAEFRTPPAALPVSILKPLKGTDPEMYESLRSHCVQEYDEYEIIFGVSEPDDPAGKFVERLQLEFPQRSIRLVVCEKNLGSNTKVSNLAQMVTKANYECLLVNDSDIRIEPDYLRRVMAPLTDPNVGLVTCLYRGVASPTLGSRLEMLGISTDFAAGVLAARKLEGAIRFGLGSTLAFRRSDLEAIGGFAALVDYLADDYEIGERLAARGLEVELSDVVVETFLPAYTFREFVEHQLRWARSIRDSRRWGYVGLVFTFLLPWALLTIILAGGLAWTWSLFGLACAIRLLMAIVLARSVLRERRPVRWLWLLPVRDLGAPVVWLASFVSHTVVWRGEHFHLKNGKLARLGE